MVLRIASCLKNITCTSAFLEFFTIGIQGFGIQGLARSKDVAFLMTDGLLVLEDDVVRLAVGFYAKKFCDNCFPFEKVS